MRIYVHRTNRKIKPSVHLVDARPRPAKSTWAKWWAYDDRTRILELPDLAEIESMWYDQNTGLNIKKTNKKVKPSIHLLINAQLRPSWWEIVKKLKIKLKK